MNNNNKKIFIVQIITSISIWSTLVCFIWNIGYCHKLSPIMLGVMSFCFSGAMALFNGIMSVVIRPMKAKKIMIVAGIIDILIYSLLYFTPINNKIIFIMIFILSACYSVISISKDKMFSVLSTEYGNKSEIIFKILRFTGPILGGVIISIMSYKEVIILNIVLLVFAQIIMFIIDNCSTNNEVQKKENRYITSEFYNKNQNIFRVLFVMIFVLTVFIQVIDAQLVTVFRMADNVLPVYIGLCIGISGIGVLVISCFMEKNFIKEGYIYMGSIGMGALMIIAGNYLLICKEVHIIALIIMFFIGGICWQIVMSTLENIIKSITDYNKMMGLFSNIGIILMVSYSLGSLLSGVIVNVIGIERVYISIGYILITVAAIGYILVKMLFYKSISKE